MDWLSKNFSDSFARSLPSPGEGLKRRRILGVNFFSGSAREAVERMRRGGLLVVPAAPALSRLPSDKSYREALQGADLIIADSAMMVLLWNLLEDDSLRRLSGLRYFSHLVADPEFRRESALYVMASPESARRNAAWLRRQGIPVRAEQLYVAPIYGNDLADPDLIELLVKRRPKNVVITLGGGVQERLGLYIKSAVDYAPAIHCIGAAIAFRSGDQVYIPDVADRLALGWLMRCLWRPRSYVPRYWAARKLAWMLMCYRSELPPLASADAASVNDAFASVSWEIQSGGDMPGTDGPIPASIPRK